MGLTKAIAQQFANPQGLGGRLATLAMNIGNQALYRSVFGAMPQDKTCAILDVGYGNGYLMKRLLKHGYQRVSGLEPSESMQLIVAKKLESAISDGRCQLMLGTLEDTPLAEEAFDVIYTINTLYFWSSLAEGFARLQDALTSQGKVVLAFYDKWYLKKLPSTKYGFRLYETSEIEEELDKQGFEIKEIMRKGYGACLCYVLTKK